jgi:hypothetical protein
VRDAGFDDVAEKLEVAYDRETKVLARDRGGLSFRSGDDRSPLKKS